MHGHEIGVSERNTTTSYSYFNIVATVIMVRLLVSIHIYNIL